MIITLIIYFGMTIVFWIIQLLPTGEALPTQVSTAFTWLGGYIALFSPILNFTVLTQVMTYVITIEIIIFGFKSLLWIISFIPGLNVKKVD